MLYCHHCGKKNEKDDAFCSNCGKKLAEIMDSAKEKVKEIKEEVVEEVEEFVKKKGCKGLVTFIIVILIIGYIILDIWAISQLTPVISADSIFASISNFDADVSLTRTSVESSVRIENPTFVPILFGRIAYDANYGNSRVADGKTGFFVMAPNSEKDIPVDLTIHHVESLWAGGKWLWNAITGKQERQYINIYADIGITKFKIGELG